MKILDPLTILLFFLISFFGNIIPLSAQNDQASELMYNVFLLGNVADLEADSPVFNKIDQLVKEEKGDNIILLSGDLIDANGFGTSPSKLDIEKADRLLKLGNKKTKVFFLPGDRDWDNAGKNGLKKVEALRKYINDKKEDRHDFLTKDGCPGPEVEDIGDHLRIISVNSQWFAHEYKRPEEEDTDCGLFNENEFWEEVEDAIKDADNRNVIITGHHPAYSFGRYAGGAMTRYNFMIPVIGSFIAGFHQNIGGPKDLAQKEFKTYSNKFQYSMEFFPGNIFVSGHERDLQVHLLTGNYHINSGALGIAKPVGTIKGNLAHGTPGGPIGSTVFKQAKKGFIQLQYFKDGAVSMIVYSIRKDSIEKTNEKALFASPCHENDQNIPVNCNYNPCLEKIIGQTSLEADPPKATGSFVAGDFSMGKLGQVFYGKNLRNIWAARLHNIPYLQLDTFDGGLIPYTTGGGGQTVSLKLKSKNGKYYAFRLIEKNQTQRKDKALMAGIYGKIVRDFISHQDPYATLVASHLMDVLDIPHSNPKVYLMPEDRELGRFRESFGGKAGLLELKPKGKKKGRVAFKDADKVLGSLQMYKKLMDDNDNNIDVEEFVKCRLLDMLIADYDRHPGNWKWLGYESEKGMTFHPFPKDRDKVFSVLDGFYRITDWEMMAPNKARFTESYKGLKSLNYNARNMDRFLTTSFTKADWIRVAKEIQALLNDEVIDESMKQYPPEIQALTANKVSRILKIRRDNLHQAAEDFYLMLARYVEVVGSNSREIFQVNRLENGDVEVTVFKKKKNGNPGEEVYKRLFRKKETREIRLYGIGKDDDFVIQGQANKSIVVRIIGGKGEDKVSDESSVSGIKKLTKVYDFSQKDTLDLGTEAKQVKVPEEIKFKSENFFHNNYILVLPNMAYNKDDGLELGASILIKRQSFNKPANARKYYFYFLANSRENYQINSLLNFSHVIGETDFLLGIDLAKPDKSFQKFYGLGNETTRDLSFDTGAYYKNNTGTIRAYAGLSRTFLEKSSLELTGVYEFSDIDPQFSKDSDTSIYQTFDFKAHNTLLGPRLKFNLDFRNSGTFPTRGAQFELNNFSFINLNADNNFGGKLESEVSIFITKRILLPITLALRGGAQHSYGEVPFYQQSFIGAQSNHRGFVRNRFGGDSALFLNTDLRFHIGTIYTSIVPLYLGLYGLFDTGRVWLDGEDSNNWHKAYGGGIYLIPYSHNFNLTLTAASSHEEDLLISFRVGFFVR